MESSRVIVRHDLDGAPGSGGAVWSLPHDGDLDANLVRLDSGGAISEHINDEVDMLIVVRRGGGRLSVDGVEHELTTGSLALVRKQAARSITAGSDGISYLAVHRYRGPLTITPPQ